MTCLTGHFVLHSIGKRVPRKKRPVESTENRSVTETATEVEKPNVVEVAEDSP
jgi:hypothetical protein